MGVLFDIGEYIPTVLASIGLVIGTSSFISGLQLVRGTAATIEGKIHRLNGYLTIILYTALVALAIAHNGMRGWSILGWFGGASIICLKLWIVKVARKRRRAFKYVSWFGASLTLMWLYIVYIHLPL